MQKWNKLNDYVNLTLLHYVDDADKDDVIIAINEGRVFRTQFEVRLGTVVTDLPNDYRQALEICKLRELGELPLHTIDHKFLSL